jgi:hypothetical protein
VALVGSRFSAWPSREVLGMDLQQSSGDVFASHNGALVAVCLLRRLALDHHLGPRHHHRVQWGPHHHLLHCRRLRHLDRHRPSCGVLIDVACSVWVVLRQLHGLLLSVSVHPTSSIVAVVVIIIVIDHHELR